jgi:hypothetical protein
MMYRARRSKPFQLQVSWARRKLRHFFYGWFGE